jgi:hypothetical protein
MKNRFKLLAAFAVFLSLAVIAASQDSSATRKGGRAGTAAPARSVAANAKRPFAPQGGGDTCGTAVPIPSLPFVDSGNTTGAADDVNTVSPGCGTGYIQTAGPDLIYSFTVGAGNSLTFNITPTTGWDPKIYVLGTCGNGATCLGGADANGPGGNESLAVSGLTPGTYFFYVDSFYSASTDPTVAQGAYDLSVSGSFGAIPPTDTPTVTNTPTGTPVPPTNTPTVTPTFTNTSVAPTDTPTVTPTFTFTPTATFTATPTSTPTVTLTSVAPTNTPTVTSTVTSTPTQTIAVPTSTPTSTLTAVPGSPTPTITSGGGGPGNGPSSPVPTLSTWMLALFAVGLAGAALFMTRRS